MTAWGVFVGMRAALREAGLDPSFERVSVVVQGAGHVGAALAGHLLDAGATVTVSDIHADRVEPLRGRGRSAWRIPGPCIRWSATCSLRARWVPWCDPRRSTASAAG